MLPSPALAEPARIDALDGVRGIAILLVVLMHALFFGVPLPGAEIIDAGALYPRLAALGWCGVDVFFVLSGFLITGILLRSKGAPRYFRNFYARRSLRIFPLYYAVIVLLLFVLERPPSTSSEKASYLLYYQNVRYALWGEQAFDPARVITWSLAIEEQFYLVWPAVVWFASRAWLVRICWMAIVGAIALRFVLLAGGLHATHFLTPCRLDTLAAGSLMAVVGSPSLMVGRLLVAVGAACLLATATLTGSSLPESPAMQRYGLVGALAFAVGVLVCARGSGWFPRVCSWGLLRSLGKYSYCIYLVHFLVIDGLARTSYGSLPAGLQQWLVANVSTTWLVLAFTTSCLVLSWAVAFTSWHLFEKWFLGLKRHFATVGAPSEAGLRPALTTHPPVGSNPAENGNADRNRRP